MSYLNANDLAESQSFKTRLKIALVSTAGNVIHEDRSVLSKARADKRNDLATKILWGPAAYADMFVWAVIANPTIASEGLDTSDGSLAYQVSQVFDAMAGVTATEMVAPD